MLHTCQPESVGASGVANRQNPAKPIRVRFCQVRSTQCALLLTVRRGSVDERVISAAPQVSRRPVPKWGVASGKGVDVVAMLDRDAVLMGALQ